MAGRVRAPPDLSEGHAPAPRQPRGGHPCDRRAGPGPRLRPLRAAASSTWRGRTRSTAPSPTPGRPGWRSSSASRNMPSSAGPKPGSGRPASAWPSTTTARETARYPTPRSVLERIAGLDPRVGVCLDVGHCRRSGLDPAEEAAACRPRLLDIHLKDVTAATGDGGAVETGRGAVDIPRFLRTLAALGFRGTAAFEYEKDGRDPLPGLAESVGYVRGVLAGQWRRP
ncbi:MAG: sugar phosphate isomerase/epimerase [Rhodopseudomonas palustris]|nr:sugar phosphate isomerase/epimerase [Rhodopseudomonas palustris]